MLQSLRARLAFLFAGTLVLATVTAAVVVVSLYQSYNRDQTEAELRKQVSGVASYYERAFQSTYNKGKTPPPKITKNEFEGVSDAKLYQFGPGLFPNAPNALPNAHIHLDYSTLHPDSRPVYQFSSGGATYIGVGAPIFSGQQPDVYLKPDDKIMVGTNALAPFIAAARGAFRLTYGLGFLYDRNFAYSSALQGL